MDHSAKILLLGKTGVGKSAFINYFLGKEVAESAAGKPVTQEYFIPYEIDDGRYPISIYDTKGLETLNADDQLDQIIKGIKKRNNSEDIFDWFHTIFYCVSMSNARFEPFEAAFIKKLQKKLTQHIHIILTHCDTCGADSIRRMRERIVDQLGSQDNIEIFEVVCVSKTKRNGTEVQPRGKEAVSERVFDLLLEDIAYRVSCDYAKTLRTAIIEVADDALERMEDLVDKAVSFKTLKKIIKNGDLAGAHIDETMEKTFQKIERDIETVQKDTDRKFNRIL